MVFSSQRTETTNMAAVTSRAKKAIGQLTTPENTITYHNALCLSPQNFAQALFSASFSWGHFNSQEKLKTMLMQNFGVTNKEHYAMVCYGISGVVNCTMTSFYYNYKNLPVGRFLVEITTFIVLNLTGIEKFK